MIKKLATFTESKFYDYFILVSRGYLAFDFIRYGYSKIADGQFGLNDTELATPIKDLSLFQIMWFMFDHEPIKTAVGVIQIICGILLLWNRTVILGVFFFIPIAANILLMDITFMNESMARGFTSRFITYFILCALILLHQRERVLGIWKLVTNGNHNKHKHSILAYVTLPITGLLLGLILTIPDVLYYLITEPKELIQSFVHLWNSLSK